MPKEKTKTITKKNMIDMIHEDLDWADNNTLTKKDVSKVVETTLRLITSKVAAGNAVVFKGFGSFASRVQPPRKARNPFTGDSVDVPEKVKVKFKASKVMELELTEDRNTAQRG